VTRPAAGPAASSRPPGDSGRRNVAAVAGYEMFKAAAKSNLDRLLAAMPGLADRLRFQWRDDVLRFAADWEGLRLAVGGGDFELFVFDRQGALRWDARFSSSTPVSLVALVIGKAVEAPS
jgi:hypothetical protein